jgi:hypothetical protein
MIALETICAALFTKVSGVTGFTTVSRRLKHWDDVPQGEQPALFQNQRAIRAVQQKGLPTKWELSLDLYLYAYSTDKTVSPSTILNPLLMSVGALFNPDPVTNFQTLSIEGVSHAWIEGEIVTDEGVLGDQAVAIIPIRILCV